MKRRNDLSGQIKIKKEGYTMTERNRLEEKRTDGKTVFDGEILHVVKDDITLPNGNAATREVIRHVGAVAIVGVTEDKKIVMERQFRYPMDEVISEIPAGKLNSKAEDKLEAAKREFQEETGYTAKQWTQIGLYYPAAAYSDEVITLFMATELEKGERNLDDDEFLDVQLVPIDDLVDQIMEGKIPDGKTQVAIMKVAKLLG